MIDKVLNTVPETVIAAKHKEHPRGRAEGVRAGILGRGNDSLVAGSRTPPLSHQACLYCRGGPRRDICCFISVHIPYCGFSVPVVCLCGYTHVPKVPQSQEQAALWGPPQAVSLPPSLPLFVHTIDLLFKILILK